MLKTRSGLPKHCSWNTDQRGVRRVRFRKSGYSTYLTGTPWGEDFMRVYAAALEGVKALQRDIGAARTTPGSFNSLCVSYYRSPEFRGLKASTQATRRNIVERFRNEHGEKPLRRLERKHIKEIIGAKADTPGAANNLLKVLRLLLSYAVDAGMLAANPAIGVRGYKLSGDGHHTWTEAEVAQFEAFHPVGTPARLAFALMLYTAARVGDVARLGWQDVKAERITMRQEKTGQPLALKMHPELVRTLASAPKTNLTFLVGPRGAPYTGKYLSLWFARQCHRAGLPQCTAHGLRKTAATRLSNAGASVDHIRALTGHKTTKEVERYTRERDQARLQEQALDLQLRAEREQKRVQRGNPKLSNRS
jgi:integrase